MGMQSWVEIGGHTQAVNGNQRFFVFLYVTLHKEGVALRGATIQTTYSIAICRSILMWFSCFLDEEMHFPTVCGDR